MNDRYQILSTVSFGGNGMIQQAWDKLKNRDVAIKRLMAPGVNPDVLMREARSLYALRHPHIITIHEYTSDEKGPFMVMEWIKGETLAQRIKKETLKEAEFKTLVTQTLEAMDAAHAAGLIHRDLKPENIMLPWSGDGKFDTKIIDFGLAQVVPPGGMQQSSMHGSIHFMAPEQFGHGHIDARTDLYALGVIYYYALTGQLTFQGDETAQVITAHLYHRHVPLEELRPDLSDELCAWVDRLTQVKPEARFQSAGQALAAFRRLGNNFFIKTAGVIHSEPAAVMILEEEEMPAVVLAEEEDEPVAASPYVEEEPEPAAAAPFVEEAAPQLLSDTEPEAASEPAAESEPESEARLTPTVFDELLTEPGPDITAAPSFAPDPVIENEPELVAVASTTAPLVQAAPARDVPPTRPLKEPAPQIATQKNMPVIEQRLPKRRMGLPFIIGAFVAVLLLQFAVVSYFQYAGREGREQLLNDLSASDQPQGSDVDVRVILDFLDATVTREKAAQVLIKMSGGSYINEQLIERLNERREHPAAVRLVEILGQRSSRDAFPLILELANQNRRELRLAAVAALGRIATANDIPKLIPLIQQSQSSDHKLIEKTLVGAIEGSDDRALATQNILKSYRAATSNPETRAILFKVITRVGGGAETLDLVKEGIADPSQKLRLAAITVLSDYPTHEPLTAITERFPVEADETCRIYLLLAAKELVIKPGPSSQQVLFLHAQSLYGNAKGTDEKQYVLNVFSRIIAPGTAEFFEKFDDPADIELSREARQIGQSFRNQLARVTSVTPDGKATPVPVEKADMRADGTVTLNENQKALVNWTQTDDWASWLVELPRNGTYEVALYQSHTSNQLGTYEVVMAGQTLLTAVVKTEGPEDFKGFVVGNITVTEPGIYRMLLKPKTLPASGDLFSVQRLAIKAQ